MTKKTQQPNERVAVDVSTGEVIPHHKPIVKNMLNVSQFPSRGIVNPFPSMTIPDQTMSLQELLDRYSRGLPVGSEHFPIYNGEEDLPDFQKMDLSEIEEFKRKATRELYELRAQHEAEESERKQKAIQDWDTRKAKLEADYHSLMNEKTPSQELPDSKNKK